MCTVMQTISEGKKSGVRVVEKALNGVIVDQLAVLFGPYIRA